MEQYLMYLRKSRVDRDFDASESEEDTLKRHESTLIQLAKNRKYLIAKTFREVVSGDSIAERPEVQKLLQEVESGKYVGVLVMEVERLARGKTSDQGIVADTFSSTGTKIITPNKTYDPTNEADEEYFEFGLFMSRREYKTINRRLQRGRKASLEEGKYIASTAPYGYEKVKLPKQKGYSLKIVPDRAAVVRHIYDLYVNGETKADGTIKQYGSFTIAKILDAEGAPSPSGGKWAPDSVKNILINPTYAGLIRWGYRPSIKSKEGTSVVVSKHVMHDVEYMEGLHEPIVPREVWEKACKIMSSRSKAPVQSAKEMKNPLSGLLRCSKCGRIMERRKYYHGRDMVICPNKDCDMVSSVLEEVELSVLDALRKWLIQHKSIQNSNQIKIERESKVSDIKQRISRISSQISILEKQRENLFDLLEQGVYTVDIFQQRTRALAEKSHLAKEQLKNAQQELEVENSISEQQLVLIPQIEYLLDVYDTLSTIKEKNDMLKMVLERIDYSKTKGGRWTDSDMQIKILPRIK